MRLLLFIAIWVSITGPALATLHDVAYGTFEAPDDFAMVRTGTADSFQGKITRKSDNFTVYFDLGPGAGTRIAPGHHDRCYFYRDHSINGISSATGLELKNGQKTVTTTIFDVFRRYFESPEELARKGLSPRVTAPPANFWAEFRDEAELAEFLLIVSTYKVKASEVKSAD